MKTLTGMFMLGLLMMSLPTSRMQAGGDPDRSQRPQGKPSPKLSLPDIQKTTLKNGLGVWLVEHHELPTVALNLVIQAGADHDPAGKPGIASMTAEVLDEGTSTRDALAISEELESIGATLGVTASLDGSFVTLNTLTKHLDKAINIYADVVTHPSFPKKEFDRLKNQRMTALLQQKDQPVAIANNVYAAILYGSAHPYGRNPFGTEKSLGAMSLDDLVQFYSTYYSPANATLIVVGDATLGPLVQRLEAAFGSWAAKPVVPMPVPEPSAIERMKVYLVDKPNAPQSEIRIGYPALARSAPDYFPVSVMNRMLGGQFTSRINLNLRERHGFTYGARSAFSFQKGKGPFTASGGIVTEKTDSALAEFLFEIKRMQQDGLTEDELTYVKKGLLGNFALTFETTSQIAGALQNVVLYGLPDDYYNNYLQNVDRVSGEDVRRVARQYLDTAHMVIVVVGDLAKIKQPVVAKQFGDVVVCDAEGNPVP